MKRKSLDDKKKAQQQTSTLVEILKMLGHSDKYRHIQRTQKTQRGPLAISEGDNESAQGAGLWEFIYQLHTPNPNQEWSDTRTWPCSVMIPPPNSPRAPHSQRVWRSCQEVSPDSLVLLMVWCSIDQGFSNLFYTKDHLSIPPNKKEKNTNRPRAIA